MVPGYGHGMPGKITLVRRPYGGRCWWCGQPADSREHRHKATDVRREFGRGPFTGPDAVVRWSGRALDQVQGPRSRRLAFEETMCQACNNVRSQPFDRAQERFNSYVKQHEGSIWASGTIDLQAVFGSTWRADAENLVRFYVKHVACRLVDHGSREQLRLQVAGGPVGLRPDDDRPGQPRLLQPGLYARHPRGYEPAWVAPHPRGAPPSEAAPPAGPPRSVTALTDRHGTPRAATQRI